MYSFNISLIFFSPNRPNYGDIPAILKRAAIGGDKTCPSNYRPISLTPVLMKLLERIICKQVISFLVFNNLLNPSQHSFRENHSCLSALLNAYDNMLLMLANNPCRMHKLKSMGY